MLYGIQNIKTIFQSKNMQVAPHFLKSILFLAFYSMLGFKSVFQRNANKSKR